MPERADAAVRPLCSVLVCSCDAYRDLWPPFFHLFRRYWPDCPYPVFLGAGQQRFSDSSVVTLASDNPNWTASFQSYLGQLETDYVLVLLEDFFLDAAVDTSLLRKRVSELAHMRGAVLRLHPKPGPDTLLREPAGLGLLARDAPYRISLQAAIWNRNTLLSLLLDGETAWEFEWNGTERSRSCEQPFFATRRTELSYRHVVERGAWFWWAARHYRREPIDCDFSARRVMHPLTAARKAVNRMRKRATDSVLPARMRRKR